MPKSPEHRKFYKKHTSHKEVWENIQKIKEVHGSGKKDRVIVKLGNPEKPHKFVYMIDTTGNEYVIALPIERIDTITEFLS